jgi:YidC/Oxa1 family membrane protein insertase
LAEYQNPQHEPGSERRLLIIFLATFALMLVLQPLYKKYFPPPTPPPQQQTQSNPAQSSASPAPAEAPTPAVPTPPVGVTKQASGESETVIENDLYRITFTNKGAQVKSWILKKYNNDAQTGPLDLVNPNTAPKFGYPLSLWTYDESLRNKLASALYVTSKEGSEASPTTVTFEYADQDVAVHKTFHFDESYVVSVETSVTQKGAPVAAFPAWPAGFGDQLTPAFYAASFVDYQYGSKVERVPPRCGFSLFSKCTQAIGGATLPGPFHWAGPTDQYFGAIFIPDTPEAATMVTLNNSIKVAQDPTKKDAKDVDVNVLGAAVGNLHGPTVERIFVGPKEFDILKKIPVPGVADNDLNGLVDFGFFGVIAKVLFLWLRWTYYHMIPNWGWAIVVQTLIITAALLPLRITQMKSMLKMQRVAPQIKSIQEKYKKYSLRDPRKAAMNEEISALYKKEGVNPAGGCLPMLIQLPFIWAYYRMLGNVIDLRHAHWLWIHDLSAADPIFVLPIMLVVTSLITQRMTPQAGMDPSQQKMMNVMMPLMMGFIFFRLAAGLNLYYTVVNIVSVAQQAVMNRTKLGQEMREMMAKRARKKDK